MESFLIKALQVVCALSLLVIIHEFGHYIFARMFGIRVEKFYLFFNPWFSLFKWKPKEPKKRRLDKDGNTRASWRDTTYGIGWLPLGGYVKIAGMIDESMDKEQMAAPARADEFRSKAAWKRLLVMMAGVIMNFVLAIVIYIGIAIHWGDKVVPYQNATEGMDYCEQLHDIGLRDGDILLSLNGRPIDIKKSDHMWQMVQPGAVIGVLRNHRDTVSVTVPEGFTERIASLSEAPVAYRFPVIVAQTVGGEEAARAGIRQGDRILRVGADTVTSFTDLHPLLLAHAGKKTPILIQRGDSAFVTEATPSAQGRLGFMPLNYPDIYPVETKTYNVFQGVPRGIELGTTQLTTYVSSLGLLFSKEGAESIGGFGAIGNLFPDRWNWWSFWNITAFLSIMLAFMNILPIPALDGGHVLFTLYEIVTRRKPSDKFLEYAQMAGMAFLLLLLVYANGNDIYRLVFK